MPYRRKKLTFAISSPDEFLSILIGTTLTTVLHYRADCDIPSAPGVYQFACITLSLLLSYYLYLLNSLYILKTLKILPIPSLLQGPKP